MIITDGSYRIDSYRIGVVVCYTGVSPVPIYKCAIIGGIGAAIQQLFL